MNSSATAAGTFARPARDRGKSKDRLHTEAGFHEAGRDEPLRAGFGHWQDSGG